MASVVDTCKKPDWINELDPELRERLEVVIREKAEYLLELSKGHLPAEAVVESLWRIASVCESHHYPILL